MKLRRLYIILVIILTAAVNSCQKDETDGIDDIRSQYTGDWRCDEKSKLLGTSNYNISIDSDPSNSSQVIICNFYNTGDNEYTYAVAAQTSLTLLQQTVSNLKIKSGTGTLSGKTKITWTYSIDVGGDIDQVTATYTKL